MNPVDLFWHIALGQARTCRLWLVSAGVECPLTGSGCLAYALAYSVETAKTKPSSEKKRWPSHFGPFLHLKILWAAELRDS
jgi:hypothetical protein